MLKQYFVIIVALLRKGEGLVHACLSSLVVLKKRSGIYQIELN
jgi:hypothetical protein